MKAEAEVLISVVVPVYNVEKFIDRCLLSIVQQTVNSLEIILVDDGSTDNSGAICDKWKRKDKRVVVVHQENKGLGAARNKGLEISKGEFIVFIDSDDWINRNMLAHMSSILIKHREVQFVDCNLISAKDEKCKFNEGSGDIKVLNQSDLFRYFFRINGENSNTSICTKLIRKELLSGFKFISGYNEDVRASYDIYKKTDKAIHLSKNYYYYYYNTNSITHRKLSVKDFDYLRVWDGIVELTRSDMMNFAWAAEINRARADLTLLGKALLYGYEKQPMIEKQLKLMKTDLRRNFKKLLFWNMPITRKILMVWLVIFGVR